MPLRLVLVCLLTSPASAQVRVQGAPEVVPVVGGQAGAGVQNSPSLSAPSVVPTLTAPLSPTLSLPTANPGAVAQAASPAAAVAAPSARLAPVTQAAQPQAALTLPPAAAVANVAVPAGPTAGAPAGGGQAAPEAAKPGASPERLSLGGRALFDGAAAPARNGVFDSVFAPARSLWGAARGFLRGKDEAPAFPPKPDQTIRVAGKKYKVGRLLASTPEWSLHEPAGFGRQEEAILVFAPEAKAAFEAERSALEALGRTDVPHPNVKAVGDGVLVLVQRNLDGWKTRESLAQGLSRSQANGMADLAARLIRAGATADLDPDNTLWEHWRGHWALKRGVGWRAGTVSDVLGQLWAWPGAVKDRGSFLSALRGRLGPDSEEWRRVVADGNPDVKTALSELSRRDAARPPPAPLKLGAAGRRPALPDAVVSPRELAKQLGYDPMTVKERWALHADDPGKLNTNVAMLEPKGKMKAVFKGADAHIIKNEVFVRKAVRAFFSEYFETPGALAVLNGYDSYMVMEVAGGEKSYVGPKLGREQRAALAMLVHTFGLGDMNPGNVYYGRAGEKTWLIDFEQALSRHGPVPNRVPDERILQEMPWVDAKEPPPIEDFLPAIKQWRAFFSTPETQAAVAAMLKASGYTPEEQAYALSAFRANVSQLEWTLQADVDFADGLRRR